MKDAYLNLFKALPVVSKRKKRITKGLLKITIPRGFVFSPEVVANYSEEDLISLVKDISISAKEINSSFHKSWGKIKKASLRQLVYEQAIHYITTYGFEALGIYDESSVYIPNESLNIPEIKENIPFVVIKGYTLSEIKDKVMSMLKSGIALKQETISDIITVLNDIGITFDEIEDIKNKETKIILQKENGMIPKEPIEFLRYVIYNITKSTLLIKSTELLNSIREAEDYGVVNDFTKYEEQYGLYRLAQIFNRFKPIFLAFKSFSGMAYVINRLSKMSKDCHKPMPEDFLNSITGRIKKGDKVDIERLKKELKKVNVFRKIRLAQALKYRIKETESITYKIRNGKSFSTDFKFKNRSKIKPLLSIILNSIVEEMRPKVECKKIYYPENIEYAIPATEKQFMGSVPFGSYVSVSKDMVIGIYWKNLKGVRTDLDLSLTSLTLGKIGWDGFYRNEQKNILFSGDMTDASKGASELFYIKKQKKDSLTLNLNNYTYYYDDENLKVPFKIIIAQESIKNLDRNYMVNPNNIIATIDSFISSPQEMLGLLVTRLNGCKFYFSQFVMGKSITASNTEYSEHARNYLINYCESGISLRELLEKAEVRFVESKEEADIDLSLESLERDTILNLIKGE